MRRTRSFQQRLESLVADMVAKDIRLDEALEQLERQFILRVLEHCDGNQSRAARALHVHRNTLRRKLERLGIR